jgi:hypothetical protein
MELWCHHARPLLAMCSRVRLSILTHRSGIFDEEEGPTINKEKEGVPSAFLISVCHPLFNPCLLPTCPCTHIVLTSIDTFRPTGHSHSPLDQPLFNPHTIGHLKVPLFQPVGQRESPPNSGYLIILVTVQSQKSGVGWAASRNISPRE